MLRSGLRLSFSDPEKQVCAHFVLDVDGSIYDLGDGEIDFAACHRVLKKVRFKGWNCVDLDRTRKGPRLSYERSGAYIVNKLEPIYK